MSFSTGEPVRMGSNRSWQWVRAGTGRWQVAEPFAQPGFLARLEDPVRLLQGRPVRERSRARPTQLTRLPLPELQGMSVVVKRYTRSGVVQTIKDLLRPCAARRSFLNAFILQRLEIPTARPVAAGQLRNMGLPGAAYFLAEEVAPAQPLRYWREQSAGDTQGMMRELGVVLGKLHRASFSHTDPTQSNFLVQLASESQPRLVVIDLDGLRFRPHFSEAHMAEDLEHLFSRVPMDSCERAAFEEGYAITRKAQPCNVKQPA